MGRSVRLMADGLSSLWETGSIPWIEVILIFVVFNFLFLSGGAGKNAFVRWLKRTSKRTTTKSKAVAVKAKQLNVSQKHKRSSRNKGWGNEEAATAGSITLSKKRHRGDQNKGWGNTEAPGSKTFSVSKKRKLSSQNKWQGAEEPVPKTSSVTQAQKSSSETKGGPVKDLADNGANGAEKGKKAASRADIPAMKSQPAAQAPTHSSPRKKSSAIRIGRRSLRTHKPLNH
jgi:hypothetical protein